MPQSKAEAVLDRYIKTPAAEHPRRLIETNDCAINSTTYKLRKNSKKDCFCLAFNGTSVYNTETK
jgi:hypothetical protein